MSLKLQVAERIRGLRRDRGLTQERLAELSERSVDAISALERGLAVPSLETLEKLSVALDMPVRDFFNFEENGSNEREQMLARLVMHARSLDDADLEIAVAQVAALARRRKP